MNVFKKVFCRCYQFCFRIVQPILPYREPKIYSSVKELNDLSEIKYVNVYSNLYVPSTDLKLSNSITEFPHLYHNLLVINVACVF